MYRIKIIFIFTMLIILILCSNCSADLKLEYDKYFSHQSGVRNIKTIEKLSLLSIKPIDSVRLKMIISLPIMYCTMALGHEVFGHGYPLRRYGIDHHYKYPPKVSVSIKDVNVMHKSIIYIGGLKFNKYYDDEFLKDSVMNGFEYNKSMSMLYSKLLYIFTLKDDGGDIRQYTSNLNEINKNNKINSYLKRNILSTTVDPLLILNLFTSSESFIFGEYLTYNINYIPTFSFNMYHTSVTREFGFSFKYNDSYIRLTYESGRDVWNEKITGFSLEHTNIHIYNFSLDVKVHHVEECTSNTLLTLNFENLYFRWKHHLKQYDDLESTDRFSVGFKF